MPSLPLKLLATGIALGMLAAVPADAAKLRKPKKPAATATTQAPTTEPAGVYVDGRYMGNDPDPNIRFQLMRDTAAVDDGPE